MSRFTPQEIEYLQSQRLARLVTIGANGQVEPMLAPYLAIELVLTGSRSRCFF